MPAAYITTLTAFTQFLAAYLHTTLYLRRLYPRDSFVSTRFHNTPVYQSRHPAVCRWILDAVQAVQDELLKGTVARIAIVVFHFSDKQKNEPATGQVKIQTPTEQVTPKSATGQVKIQTPAEQVEIKSATGQDETKSATGQGEKNSATEHVTPKSATGQVKTNSATERVTPKSATGQVKLKSALKKVKIQSSTGQGKAQSAAEQVKIQNATGHGKKQRPTGQVKILERYMLDVSSFPVVTQDERRLDIDWERTEAELQVEAARRADDDDDDGDDDDDDDDDEDDGDEEEKEEGEQEDLDLAPDPPAEEEERPKDEEDEEEFFKPLDAAVAADLGEQFRAAFITLSARASQLDPLPPACSFNITIELKDDADVDPPVEHPQQWMPTQPSLQRTGRKGAPVKAKGKRRRKGPFQGQDLVGARVTPIRTVEAGVFRFEAWVEEAKAKFVQDC